MSDDKASKKAYTLSEAAEAVGTSVSNLRRCIGRNELTVKYIGFKPVVLATELDSWLQSLPNESPSSK